MATKPTEDVKDIANDTPPSAETLNKISEYTVLNRKGEQHSFKNIYDGPDSERVLVVFIRHFFCGSCREFITALSKISPTSLQTLPTPTSIVIVGLGDPGLIDSYVRQTKSPFPIYTDPSMKLYTELELVVSKAMGPRPAYFRKNMACIVAESFVNWVKHAGTGLMFKGGKTGQNGGEFLFESAPGGDGGKVVSWFHRMGGARDHTSMEGLRGVLDPEGLVLGKP